jgi:hypothetical protein
MHCRHVLISYCTCRCPFGTETAICTFANFLGLVRGAAGVVLLSKSGPVPPLVRSQEVIMSVQSAWSVLELHHQCCSMVNGQSSRAVGWALAQVGAWERMSKSQVLM